MNPLVSIITPSFNKGKFIEETILSVISQNYQNIEYIIIDGGSTDETLNILKQYSNIKIISEPDNGQADAINKGFRIAHGEILAFLNADDLYFTYTVEKIVQYFKDNPHIGLVYGDIIHIDENGENEYPIHSGKLDLNAYLGCMYYLPQPTVFFRKSVFDTIGEFDVNLNLAMDLDYWLRVYFKFDFGYIPEPLAKARIYQEAKSTALNYKYLDERLAIIDKISQYLTPEQKQLAISRIHYYGGLEYLRTGKITKALRNMSYGIKQNPKVVITPGLYFSFFNSFFGRETGDILKKYLFRRD
jgi:glycosyltransferase involved in cell wall biosynthesis